MNNLFSCKIDQINFFQILCMLNYKKYLTLVFIIIKSEAMPSLKYAWKFDSCTRVFFWGKFSWALFFNVKILNKVALNITFLFYSKDFTQIHNHKI